MSRSVYNQLYSRFPEDARIIRNYGFVIVGCGGVGTWVAISLSLVSAESRFVLIDNDNLEIHNLGRLPYPIIAGLAGIPKALALARYLSALRPNNQYRVITARVTAENLGVIAVECKANLGVRSGYFVIDATDNNLGYQLAKKIARLTDARFIAAHYDGFNFSIEYYPRIDEASESDTWAISDESGYTTVPSHPITCMFLASLVTYLVLKRPRKKIVVTSRSLADLYNSILNLQ